MPTLKGTEASLFYVQCFLYFVSSSINVYFSHNMAGYFLDTTRVCVCVCVCVCDVMVFASPIQICGRKQNGYNNFFFLIGIKMLMKC